MNIHYPWYLLSKRCQRSCCFILVMTSSRFSKCEKSWSRSTNDEDCLHGRVLHIFTRKLNLIFKNHPLHVNLFIMLCKQNFLSYIHGEKLRWITSNWYWSLWQMNYGLWMGYIVLAMRQTGDLYRMYRASRPMIAVIGSRTPRTLIRISERKWMVNKVSINNKTGKSRIRLVTVLKGITYKLF